MRLDCYLYEKGLSQSRQKAQELIESGAVWVGGKQILKSSFKLDMQEVRIIEQKRQWVARSGEKLDGFLRSSTLVIEDKDILDIGSSTGGFSEVLLMRGAKSVTCVDVGSNQLHPKIKADKRIKMYENQDIRTFSSPPFDLVVCDVSFISLDLIMGKIYDLTSKDCLLLFKPQFEVGREVKRNKKGVIMEAQKIQARLKEFLDFVLNLGMIIQSVQKSILKGKCGNEEYFIHLLKP